MPERFFDAAAHQVKGKFSESGRGTVVFFRHRQHHLVLKTYHRGGLLGRFVRNSYVYTGIINTRMWQEFHLLQVLHRMGLPVPRPAAARCVLKSLLTYQGELMMEEIPGARTLVDLMGEALLSEETWSRVGRLVAEFHHHGVCHGDLNASNILQSKDGSLYLIDFDKSSMRENKTTSATLWQMSNLKRLQRSLQKYARKFGTRHYNNKSWQCLMNGYIQARQRLGETAFVCPLMEEGSPLISAAQ